MFFFPGTYPVPEGAVVDTYIGIDSVGRTFDAMVMSF